MIARNGDVRLAYDTAGAGPDLLMIGGSAEARPLWALVRPALDRSFRTIAFDPRDSGESTIVSAPYTLPDLADDAIAVLDAAESRRAHVIGHSLGGAVAQEMALTYPQRIASLILVSTWARGDTYSNSMMELLIDLTQNVRDDRTLLESIVFIGAGVTTLRTAPLRDMTEVAMQVGPLAPRQALERQWRLDATVDTLDRLAAVAVPTLVMCGTEDRLLPPYFSEQLVSAIPGASLARIEGVGHLPMVHAPDAFLSAVREFVTGIGRAR
jgi:pimeloyl-ACP methyl ester carboxylesterase